MARYSKAESGTATKTNYPLPTACDNCPRINTTSSSTASQFDSDIVVSTIGQLTELKKQVQKLQEESKKAESFYRSTAKLNNTVRVVVIVLMIIPIIQLILCTGVVYILGIEDKLPGLLKWVLGGVSVLSILELIVGGIKLYLYEKRMDELEKVVDEIKAKSNSNEEQ